MSQTPLAKPDSASERVLNAQFTVILAVCLVAAAVGGGLAYTTHVDPGTETELRTVSSLTVESEYVHSAEVTEPNSVFDTGTVLDGRNTYFTRVAPVLDVDVGDELRGRRRERHRYLLRVGARDTERRQRRRDRLLGRAGDADDRDGLGGVEPGETATASFALNSSEVDATASEIESDLGASPGETETFVTTAVTVEGHDQRRVDLVRADHRDDARSRRRYVHHRRSRDSNRTRRNRPSRSPSSRATDLSVLRADRCCSWRGLLGLAGWRTPAARSISRSRRPSG